MCGIVGVIGLANAPQLVRRGLQRLEYRGYDSAGVAWVDGQLECARAVGKVANLQVPDAPMATLGIGHTRWATHGGVSLANAHPHEAPGVAVVHNGTLHDHLSLRTDLAAAGVQLKSDTDTEVLAHRFYQARENAAPLDALRATFAGLDGSWAALFLDHATESVAFIRHQTPLVIGIAEEGYILASDITAVVEHTKSVVYLEDGDHGLVTSSGIELYDAEGNAKPLAPQEVSWNIEQAERGGYAHYMLKEIHETPRAVSDCLAGRIGATADSISLDIDESLFQCSRIALIACGTSYHAGLMGKQFLERWANVPVDVIVASEVRSQPMLLPPDALLVGISQSGETLDTLEALKSLAPRGFPILGITNVQGSTLERMADDTIHLHVGPEVGVAATKTFVGQVTTLAMLALAWAARRRTLPSQQLHALLQELHNMPRTLEAALALEDQCKEMGHDLADARSLFFLGKGIHHASALEAALKFKEITYAHAEGMGAAELKHGPFALLDSDTPCIFFRDDAAMQTSVMEVQARGAPTYVIDAMADGFLAGIAAKVIEVPKAKGPLGALPFAVVAQLVSYHAAHHLERDIDKPRNLAKSVTVE